MEIDKVSIVLPTYNGDKYISQSIESCLNQSYKNIEFIIIDDASTDQTFQIISSYKDRRIKIIRNKKNKGLPYSLNKGFENSIGEYLTWISDDNFFVENAIEKMVQELKERKCSFVYSDYFTFKEDDIYKQQMTKLPDKNAVENGNFIGPSFLYTRKVRDNIGEYNPKIALAEDYDYWIRVSKKFQMVHLNQPLYYYRLHSQSLTSKFFVVRIVDLLVRLKNDILDVDRAVHLFYVIIAQKRFGFQKLNEFFAKKLYSKIVNEILREFHSENIDYEETKIRLVRIMETSMIIRFLNIIFKK